MAELIPVQAFALAVLAQLVEADTGSLLGCLVHLFSSNTTPTPATIVGDVTEADYSGYAAKAVTFLAPSISDDGQPELVGTVAEFRPTGTTVTNVIYGGWIVNATSALRYWFRFDNPPLPMGATTDSILLTVRVRMSPSGLIVTVS